MGRGPSITGEPGWGGIEFKAQIRTVFPALPQRPITWQECNLDKYAELPLTIGITKEAKNRNMHCIISNLRGQQEQRIAVSISFPC